MVDFYEYSTPELVRLLGNRFKEYRIRCNLTQKDVSEQSGIGLTTIHKFENGTAGNILLSTLRVINGYIIIIFSFLLIPSGIIIHNINIMLYTLRCLLNVCTGMGGENIFLHLLSGEKTF